MIGDCKQSDMITDVHGTNAISMQFEWTMSLKTYRNDSRYGCVVPTRETTCKMWMSVVTGVTRGAASKRDERYGVGSVLRNL